MDVMEFVDEGNVLHRAKSFFVPKNRGCRDRFIVQQGSYHSLLLLSKRVRKLRTRLRYLFSHCYTPDYAFAIELT